MSSSTIPTTPSIRPDGANLSSAARPNGGRVPNEVIDSLDVHVAGADEHESVADLATRAGSTRPTGALMVAAVDGRPLAAVSMSTGEVVNEPTPSGEAAAAVIRYRLARLGR